MDEDQKFIKCVEIITTSEDYLNLLIYLQKHRGEDPAVDKWLDQDMVPFMMEEFEMRHSTEEEKKKYGIDWFRKR